MYRMKYSIQNINNGALSGAKPMPLKDSTSDNQASFNMARHTYLETIPATPEPVELKIEKKWFGSRDGCSKPTCLHAPSRPTSRGRMRLALDHRPDSRPRPDCFGCMPSASSSSPKHSTPLFLKIRKRL